MRQLPVLFIAFAAATLPTAKAAPGDVMFEETSHQAAFKAVTIAEGLSFPWGLDFLPDGGLIVTEWTGAVRIVRDGEVSAPLTGGPVLFNHPNGRRLGMLDVALHPDHADNQLVYLCYHHGTYDSNVSRVARARLDGDQLRDVEVILDGDNRSNETAHAGCRLVWDKEGRLIVTAGDRRHLPDESQNLSNLTGSIVNLNDDGSIPADNPFVRDDNARPEIWAYGVRNVQGAARHPETGALWFSEHGPLGGDEVNILRRGANYGWPIATYGIDYDGMVITEDAQLSDVDGPLVYWRPSTAPSGLAFYTGDDFPDWQGDLFMGSLGDRRLIRMELDGERVLFQEHLLEDLDERIRTVKMGLDGYLYVMTDAEPGVILRLEPAQ
ncbi:MAG: PQQ-dependent sugar dehydrogenase [Pseudomonadota bacterium]